MKTIENIQFEYYYYDEVCGKVGISKGILDFGNNGFCEIKDKAHENNAIIHYEEESRPQFLENILILQLNTKETQQRNLHLALHISNFGTTTEIVLGQYHNLNHKNTIVSGSLLCIKLNEYQNPNSFVPKFFPKGSDEYDGLQDYIKDFLRKKENNRIKMPNEIFSVKALKMWMKSKKTSFTPPIDDKLSLFISCPATSFSDQSEYNKMRVFIEEISEVLKKEYNFKIYNALVNCNTLEDFKVNNVLLTKTIEELDKCDVFMMVLPKAKTDKPSSIFVEFGYVLNRNIPCAIFVEKNKIIPNLVQGAIRNGSQKIIEYKYQNLESLKRMIMNNGQELFYN